MSEKKWYSVVAPIEYDADGETKTEWLRCGVAFKNKDGDTFTLKLRALPVAQDGEVTLVIREREKQPREDDAR